MKSKFFVFGILLLLIGCRDKKIDGFMRNYRGFLPCNISANETRKVYQLDFNDRVLVYQNDEKKAIYDNFKISDLYLFNLNISKDSISGIMKGEITFNIEDYLCLFVDSISDTLYYVGPYIYQDISIENIVQKDNSIDFQIIFEKKSKPLTINAGIVRENETEYFKIDTSFIGKLHSDLNPSYSYQKADKYFFKIINSKEEAIKVKKDFLKNQLNNYEQELKTKKFENKEKRFIENSTKYLMKTMALYEN